MSLAETPEFPKDIKNVLIVYRPDTKNAIKIANELASWLIEKGLKPFSHPKQKLKVGSTAVPPVKQLSRIQLVIVLGGDGTYLEAVRLLEGRRIPILGINQGSLGFLTNTRAEDLYPTLEKTLNAELEMRPRRMLTAKVFKGGRLVKEATALNDLVLERGARSHLINVQIFNNKMFTLDVKADGLIVSSPTGSTAYNLAAGGPILHPEVEAFVMTPVCPHSLTSRPILLPDHRTITLKLHTGHQKASLTVDGQTIMEIADSHEIKIQRSKYAHYVLRDPSHNYFNLVAEKLKFGLRS